MTILGLIIFVFCLWAVFSRRFCDGIVVKHLLTFSAITAALTVLDPQNTLAAMSALGLMLAGISYWMMKHRAMINKRLTELFR